MGSSVPKVRHTLNNHVNCKQAQHFTQRLSHCMGHLHPTLECLASYSESTFLQCVPQESVDDR